MSSRVTFKDLRRHCRPTVASAEQIHDAERLCAVPQNNPSQGAGPEHLGASLEPQQQPRQSDKGGLLRTRRYRLRQAAQELKEKAISNGIDPADLADIFARPPSNQAPEKRNLNECLEVMRKSKLSSQQFTDIVKGLHLQSMVPTMTVEYGAQLGNQLSGIFGVKSTEDGKCWFLNFEVLMQTLLTMYNVSDWKEEEVQKLQNETYLTMDSWYFNANNNSTKFTGVGLILGGLACAGLNDWWALMLWWGADNPECAQQYLGPVGAWIKELKDAGVLVGQRRVKVDPWFIADMGCLKSVFGHKFCWLCGTTKETAGILYDPEHRVVEATTCAAANAASLQQSSGAASSTTTVQGAPTLSSYLWQVNEDELVDLDSPLPVRKGRLALDIGLHGVTNIWSKLLFNVLRDTVRMPNSEVAKVRLMQHELEMCALGIKSSNYKVLFKKSGADDTFTLDTLNEMRCRNLPDVVYPRFTGQEARLLQGAAGLIISTLDESVQVQTIWQLAQGVMSMLSGFVTFKQVRPTSAQVHQLAKLYRERYAAGDVTKYLHVVFAHHNHMAALSTPLTQQLTERKGGEFKYMYHRQTSHGGGALNENALCQLLKGMLLHLSFRLQKSRDLQQEQQKQQLRQRHHSARVQNCAKHVAKLAELKQAANAAAATNNTTSLTPATPSTEPSATTSSSVVSVAVIPPTATPIAEQATEPASPKEGRSCEEATSSRRTAKARGGGKVSQKKKSPGGSSYGHAITSVQSKRKKQ